MNCIHGGAQSLNSRINRQLRGLAYMGKHTHAHAHARTHAHTHTPTHPHASTPTHPHTHTHTNSHTHTHTHTHTPTHTHVHTHQVTQKPDASMALRSSASIFQTKVMDGVSQMWVLDSKQCSVLAMVARRSFGLSHPGDLGCSPAALLNSRGCFPSCCE